MQAINVLLLACFLVQESPVHGFLAPDAALPKLTPPYASSACYMSKFFGSRATSRYEPPPELKRKEKEDKDTNCDLAGEDYNQLVEEMAESVDLSRETTRVESLSSYVVVSVLTATASFNTIQQLPIDPNPALDVLLLHNSGMVISALSALAGIYATVIFSLCTAYSLTSLGLGSDDLYDSFMTDTQSLRMKGFQAYIFSLGLFLVELTLVTSERLSPSIRYPFLVSFAVLATLVVSDWNLVMKLAAPIFVPINNGAEEPPIFVPINKDPEERREPGSQPFEQVTMPLSDSPVPDR